MYSTGQVLCCHVCCLLCVLAPFARHSVDKDVYDQVNYRRFMSLLQWQSNPLETERPEVCACACVHVCVHMYIHTCGWMDGCVCRCVWLCAAGCGVGIPESL